MQSTSKPGNYFARTLALALACCMVLFLVQVVVHDHEKGEQETACRVCHAAHIGLAPAINAFLVNAPILPEARVQEIPIRFHKELFAHDSPSRAPPSA
jgi:hypothetical protein